MASGVDGHPATARSWRWRTAVLLVGLASFACGACLGATRHTSSTEFRPVLCGTGADERPCVGALRSLELTVAPNENPPGGYELLDSRTGALVARDPDPAAVVQRAIEVLGADGGTVVLRPGNYTLKDQFIRLPAQQRGWLRILGQDAVIRTSPRAPTAFLLDPTLDVDGDGTSTRDVFRRLWIEGVTVDASGGLLENDGRNRWNQTLIGTKLEGNIPGGTGRGLDSVVVRHCRARGVPNRPGLEYYFHAISFAFVALPAPAPEVRAENLLIEDVRVEGHAGAVEVIGYKAADGRPVRMDNVQVRDVIHDAAYIGQSYLANDFSFGYEADGGALLLERLTGVAAGDGGVEVNNWRHAVLRDSVFRNPSNACIAFNRFLPAGSDVSSRFEVDRVNCIIDRPATGNGGAFLLVQGKPGAAVGDVIVRSSRLLHLAGPASLVLYSRGPARSIEFDDFSFAGGTRRLEHGIDPLQVWFDVLGPTEGPPSRVMAPLRLTIRRFRGSQAFVGSSSDAMLKVCCIFLYGASGPLGVRLVVDDFDARLAFSVPDHASIEAYGVSAGAHVNVSGSIRGLRLETSGDVPTGVAVVHQGSASATSVHLTTRAAETLVNGDPR